MVFLMPCRKRYRQRSRFVLLQAHNHSHNSANFSPKGFGALHAVYYCRFLTKVFHHFGSFTFN